jgi:hypothetical protein
MMKGRARSSMGCFFIDSDVVKLMEIGHASPRSPDNCQNERLLSTDRKTADPRTWFRLPPRPLLVETRVSDDPRWGVLLDGWMGQYGIRTKLSQDLCCGVSG